MKQRSTMIIVGRNVELVPYIPKFIPKYHEFMKDPYIQEMTGTEPFDTLDEEKECQRSWDIDPYKYIFIVLSSPSLFESICHSSDSIKHEINDNEIERMIGDVNLFLHHNDDDDDDDGRNRIIRNGEINIMIADTKYRNKGLAKETIYLIMRYGIEYLHIQRYFVKINATNTTSLHLFKSIGFIEINYVEAFTEYELEFIVSQESQDVIFHYSNHAIFKIV